MLTRSRSRMRVVPPRLKAITPARMNIGATTPMLKVRICTITVLPTLAPSITASAGASAIRRPAMKPEAINPVAVLLCKAAVMPDLQCSIISGIARPKSRSIRRFRTLRRTTGREARQAFRLVPGCPRQSKARP